jgi:hypothetical protein
MTTEFADLECLRQRIFGLKQERAALQKRLQDADDSANDLRILCEYLAAGQGATEEQAKEVRRVLLVRGYLLAPAESPIDTRV